MGQRGRPKTEQISSRKRLLSVAQAVFAAEGIHSVSVEALCEKAGVSKVTFYKHFSNLRSLVLALMEDLVRQGLEFEQTLQASEQSFPDKIRAIVDFKHQMAEHLGAFFLRDLLDGSMPEVLAFLHQAQQASYDRTRAFMIQGQAAGALNPGMSPEFLLYITDQIQAMLQDPRLGELIPDATQRSHLLVDFVFWGISCPGGLNG